MKKENKIKKKPLSKGCFGTKEWSKNSGICCNCKLKEKCGKASTANKYN